MRIIINREVHHNFKDEISAMFETYMEFLYELKSNLKFKEGLREVDGYEHI